MWKREYLERNRGLQPNVFSDIMKKAGASDDTIHDGVPRTPDTGIMDPYGSLLKPKDVPVWDHCPATPEEECIYYGVHIHSESNPLGLHSHVIGGKLSGGHSHGPQNRFGAHHHKKDAIEVSVHIDGVHTHESGTNHPAGEHSHIPENFA